MGIAFSIVPSGKRDADNALSESEKIGNMEITLGNDTMEEPIETDIDDEARTRAKEEDMEEFKKQLEVKREQRKEILSRHRAEKEYLEKSLQRERISKLELAECNQKLHELLIRNNISIPEDIKLDENTELTDTVIRLTEDFEKLKINNNKLRKDLAVSNSSLQCANSDIADLHAQNNESMKQIQALKEVITVSKTMLNLREDQLNELKNKLMDIERTLADRETNLLSTDLRQEYERQLQNIRTLRGLYEERARLAEVTRQGLARDLEEQKILYQAELIKSKNSNDKVEELEAKVDSLLEIIENKNIQIASSQDETNGLKAQMSVVNKLFSQVLLGYKTKQDLDTLVHRLEENHGLLTQMAGKENDSEASSALPKLLLELVSQVDDNEENNNNGCNFQESSKGTAPNTTAEEIVENLPKVWKVLIELLSHQSVAENNPPDKVTTCYKSVETKSGPVLVPSVSQTYIRLKDLIVEKLGLIKEVNRMKQLTTHLESRLEEQERRLCLVTSELGKTWHVVGRLRRHHHQLHTHEKILKYELQQKRKLLNELKEELEYCREKWEQAREKQSQSEKDWKILRAEFSDRKTKLGSPLCNNSAESGYSDERPSDESSESNDESEYVAEPLVRCKKKLKKSFETIFDSSTDYNQAAEREDPASDMIDVADLPLDTQDGDENHEASDMSRSESFLKHDKLCEETEDECVEIVHDDLSAEDICIEITEISNNITICNIDNNESVEQSSDQIDEIVDSVINLPVTSFNQNNEQNTNSENNVLIQKENGSVILDPTDNSGEVLENIHNVLTNTLNNTEQIEQKSPICNLFSDTDKLINQNHNIPETHSHVVDFKAILENVRLQNERLAKKDEKLENLEAGCSRIVNNMTETIKSGEEMLEKLDILQNKYRGSSNKNNSEDSDEVQLDITNAASTTSEIDHEARFAARDLRLKRLEEQTKSLVTKVNKTTSKGVKINYKLEELHNIYGSENSRASTPSEDNSDKSKDDEPGHE